MPEYLYPGVYVEELDTGNKPIEGVSTSTVGFLGIATRGPTIPTFITSYTEFVRTFGGHMQNEFGQPTAYLAYGVEGFFQNGGLRCWVARVTSGTAKASTAELGELQVAAAGPALGDPVKAAQTASLIEVFDNLSSEPTASTYFVGAVSGVSNLVTVKQKKAGRPADKALALLDGSGGGVKGDDGGPLAPGDFDGSAADPANPTALLGLAAVDDISILCCPDESALGRNAIADKLRTQCENMKDRFAIVQAAFAEPRPVQPTAQNSKYAAFYFPWLNVVDSKTGLKISIPHAGHIAGIYARSDTERGVHKDPANEVIRGIDSLQVPIDNQAQSILNPIGVNALRFFKGMGNLVWGGRTTSSDPDWKYINVRRLFIFVEKSIERGTQWVVFDINDEPTWARVRRSVGAFLNGLWLDGMLQGAKREDAYFVRCDRTTMTQADIDNGRLIVVIGIAPVKPAEFVIFRIGQWTGGSDITEG